MAAPANVDAVQLPDFLAFGAQKIVETATVRIVTASGHEQRIQQWAQPRLRFSIRQSERTLAQIQELLAFVAARGGMTRGFLFRDPSDYQAVSQPLVAVTGGHQIVKTYVSGGVTVQKPIYKPETGTVSFSGGGTLDYTTGLITGNAGGAQTWTGSFHLPMIFSTDQPSITMISAAGAGWYEFETEIQELLGSAKSGGGGLIA